MRTDVTEQQQVALDALEAAFGVRLEAHQVLAMAVTMELKKYRPDSTWLTRRDLRESDRLPWLEVLRQAYAETAGRRKSRAERRGKACGSVTWSSPRTPDGRPLYPEQPEYERRCCRDVDHDGACSPGVTRYPRTETAMEARWRERREKKPVATKPSIAPRQFVDAALDEYAGTDAAPKDTP